MRDWYPFPFIPGVPAEDRDLPYLLLWILKGLYNEN
jgi:hypothetical protein